MAFSTAGFPEAVIREMLTGIVAEEKSFCEGSVGRLITDKTTMAGRISRRGTTGSVGRGENRKLGPLEEARAYDYDVGDVPYNAGAYVGYGLLSDEERNDAEYMFDRDAMQLEIETARREANTGLDRDYGDALASTVLNQEFDVVTDGGGDWANATNTMTADLRHLREVLVPKADLIIVGRHAGNIMMSNDDLLATPIGGNAYSGGAGARNLLEEWLKTYIGFSEVQFMERLFNSAGIGQPAVLEYIFDLGIWVGYKDDLALVHPNAPDQDSLDITRIARKRANEIQYSRYDDPIRPSTEKGVTVTALNTNP